MWTRLPVSAKSPVTARLPVSAKSPVTARSPVTAKCPVSARMPVSANSPMCSRSPVSVRSPLSAKLPMSARLATRSLEAAVTLLLLFTASVASFECFSGHCREQVRCTNPNNGPIKCLCNSKYKGYSTTCLDINDCAKNTNQCSENNGGYVCDCDIGFTKSPDGRSCFGAYPVGEVQHEVGTHHITLQLSRVGERVEIYTLTWCEHTILVSTFMTYNQRATLGNLKPGQSYPIVVSAGFFRDLELFSIELRTRPFIESVIRTFTSSGTGDDDDTLEVYYTPTPQSSSEFDEYRFWLEGAGSAVRTQSRPATEPTQTVHFTGLVPGRLYTVTMRIASRNITSEPVRRQEQIPPRPITQLNFTDIGPHQVTVTWDKPLGHYEIFRVRFGVGTAVCHDISTKKLSITVSSLRPHTNYTFVVEVSSGDGELKKSSPAYSKIVTTKEALPPAPRQFHVLAEEPGALNFSWQLNPAHVDGVLHRFLLEYAPTKNLEAKTTLEFPHDARTGAVTDLPKGEYLFELCAETGAGAGPAARLLRRIDWETLNELRRSSTTVTVSIRGEVASPAAGKRPTYTLVLTEQLRYDTPAHLPSWQDVHALDAWPPYQVTEPYYPSNSSSVAEFTIGSDQCDADGRGYCNGPLKPGTKYYVKLRIFTAPGNFIDTAYIVVHTDALDINYVAIITSSIFAMALVVLVIIAVRNRCWIKYEEPTTPRLPTSEEPKPFYVNLLFRKQCAKEIAEIEQRDRDEFEHHYEEIHENNYEEIELNDYE